MFVKLEYGGITMPVVQIEGVFMGASIITKEFRRNKRTSLSIDLYQKMIMEMKQ